MTKIIHNAILHLCIHQLQKTMQQNHVVITYTYDCNNHRCSSLSVRGISRTQATHTYALIPLHATRSLPHASLTYNYAPLRLLPTRHRASNHTEPTNPNNISTITATSKFKQEQTETTESQTYTYDTTYANMQVYYYGYRYYSPELGRWINRDPVGERWGVNLQGFVLNNPIMMVDVMGFKAYAPEFPEWPKKWNRSNPFPPQRKPGDRKYPWPKQPKPKSKHPWNTDPLPTIPAPGNPPKPSIKTYGPLSCPDGQKHLLIYAKLYDIRSAVGGVLIGGAPSIPGVPRLPGGGGWPKVKPVWGPWYPYIQVFLFICVECPKLKKYTKIEPELDTPQCRHTLEIWKWE